MTVGARLVGGRSIGWWALDWLVGARLVSGRFYWVVGARLVRAGSLL